MQVYKRIINMKNGIILLSVVLFCLFTYCEAKSESKRCMGIPLITEETLYQMAFTPVEIGNIVSLESHLTPYDENSKKIYLPCVVDENTKFHNLEGKLTSVLPEYDLFFLWESAFETMQESVMLGCNFTLFAIDSNGNFASYPVIFTTFPIVDMKGEVVRIDEREREVYDGGVTVWDPSYQDTGRLNIQESQLEWHVRGYSSMSFRKKSLKLNLKEKNGNNNDLALLNFEGDDDYILNPMWFDDVKIREKLAIDLWNEMAAEKKSKLKMSGGEYCEILINGEYQGLRLMQNKIEKKYLFLDSDDILFKGNNVNLGTKKPPEEVYEVISSEQTKEVTYQTMYDFFYETDFSNVDLESWVDLQLFLFLGNLRDNKDYKNIYYVIQRDKEQERLSFIPWDTDMSFGIYWEDGFRLMPESVELLCYRKEYDTLLTQYPELKKMMANRWKELRSGVFSEENILGKIDSYDRELTLSGALHRDYNVLGWNSWGGEDTLEDLKIYIRKRLEILDKALMEYENE